MTNCPSCGFSNIDGVDDCDKCGQSLTYEYLAEPATAVERGLLKDSVRVLEPNSPVTVSPDTPVGAVLEKLVERSIGCVVVVDDKKLVGIFSERDALLKLNTEAATLRDQPIAEFMTPVPQSLASDSKIAFAVQRMDLGSYRHVPIVNHDAEVEGIISVRDILRYLTEQMSAE